MTIQEVILEVSHLSLEDRLQLLEMLTHTLREEWHSEKSTGSELAQLRGLLKSADPASTDQELADAYTTHLLEKYT